MPHKKKKLFTKANSTKYVLVTDGRDENGKKIQQNVLVPVSGNRASGSSVLFSNLVNVCSVPNEDNSEEEMETKKGSKPGRAATKISESAIHKDLNLDKLLNEMADSSDSEDEEFDMLKSKMKNLGFFDCPNRSANYRSNVQVEILEDDENFSDDFGQFSDAESDSDFDSQSVKPTLTSAKVDCPESLKILNEGFEKVLEEYADDQIGGLDDEEICGTFSTENEQLQNFINTPLTKEAEEIVIGECDETIKKKILLLMEVEHPENIVHIKTEKPLEFDCESIISTYSNKYNHPVLIKEESKIRKINIPDNPLRSRLTKSQLKTLESESEESEEDDDDASAATSCNIRVKGETQEQRRERKALFKEAKRESRKLKKENKLAFKYEKKLQSAHAINTRINMGIKLV